MKELDDIDLMAYADGELSATESERIAKYVESSSEAQAKLQALQLVREGVRTHLELATDAQEKRFATMWNRIDQSLIENRSEMSEKDRSIPVDHTFHHEKLWVRILQWIRGHRGHIATGLVSASVAAMIVMAIRPPSQTIIERTVSVPRVTNTRPTPVGMRSTPTSLDYLRVVGGSGTVLTVGGDDQNSPTTIIWVTEDEDTLEGPI